MNTKNVLPRIILTALLLFVPGARAQIVADGATKTLSDVTNTFTGDVTVGTNGSFTLLVLSNNALLTNSGSGTIGLNTTAKSNEVRLLSPSARWFVCNRLMVGSNGAFNRLVVSNGATVRDNSSELGLNVSASNNVAVVTGSGSVWSASGFSLGFNGAGNQLIVSNGGVLRANSSSAGISSTSSNNVAIVTGSGSLWTNAAGIQFGFGGAGNQLIVSDGGVLHSSPGFLGSGVAASSNVALVTGSGSLWTNTSELYVGHSGAGNRLMVSAGGTVRNGHSYIGASTFGSNNLVLVTDTGSLWNSTSDLEIGPFSANNRMIVSNGATVFVAGHGLIGTTTNGNGNSAIVSDPGSRWLIATNLYVGSNGALSRLTIANGGLVANGLGMIGESISSSNNLAVVTGSGSVWSNRQGLIIGNSGKGNRLEVSDAALLTTPGSADIGLNVGANSNSVLIAGVGSQWLLGDGINVGYLGSGNRLVLSNGAAIVTDSFSYLGQQFASTNNEAVVTGAGTTWTSGPGELFVGYLGRNNWLLVSNGAVVVSLSGTIGSSLASTNNLATVTGAGSSWSNANDLRVGDVGPANRLVVSNGALVVNNNGIIGLGAMSAGNAAMVSGAGTVWSNRESFYIGLSGRGNRLEVNNGGSVWNLYTSMGFSDSSSNNSVLVTGAGSLLTNLDELFMGDGGPGNLLVVSAGGFVLNGYVAVGFNESSSNNSVLVTDEGSLCSSATALDVGRMGSRNQLVVSNGATVTAGASVILGVLSNSLNNRVVVDGGTLRVSNALGNAVLDIRRGTNVLNAGLIDVQRLLLTNTPGFFEFNGGKLVVGNSSVNNGQLFRVGNGVSPATFALTGNGAHSFVNGLTVSANALLTGNGAVSGILTVQSGGVLAPGTSVGKIVLSSSPTLQGAVVMEISKNGATLTNDQIQVTGTLTYGGSLIVSNVGPTVLAAGDNFKLFSAGTFAGSFASISLPPLGAGLGWTNKLLVDGSMEVVGVAQPKFATVTLSGPNVIIAGTGGAPNAPYAVLTATNVALPLSNWVSIVTNQFDTGGNFSFTNGIAPGERQRYFRIRTP